MMFAQFKDSEMTISGSWFRADHLMADQVPGSWVLGVDLGYQNRRHYILKYRSCERNTM